MPVDGTGAGLFNERGVPPSPRSCADRKGTARVHPGGFDFLPGGASRPERRRGLAEVSATPPFGSGVGERNPAAICRGKHTWRPLAQYLCKLWRLSPLLRARQIAVEGKSVAIQIIEGEFARAPRSTVNTIGSALDAMSPIFVDKRVRVFYQKPKAGGPHFVFELELHVKLDRVPAKSDVVRRIGFVSKGQLEAKLLGIELNRPLNVSCAENRVNFLNIADSENREVPLPRRPECPLSRWAAITLWTVRAERPARKCSEASLRPLSMIAARWLPPLAYNTTADLPV